MEAKEGAIRMTRDQLISFSARVADAFRAKRIKAPVHLPSETQADHLIRIFHDFKPGDWLFSNWRSMWHCLLAGWPEDELFDAICQGRSMYLMSRKYRTICSSIVGGILPIALGVAAGVKRSQTSEPNEIPPEMPRVWVFVGDMTATTGLFHEFKQYARGHDLPVRIVVEDNGLSTDTNTLAAWGTEGGIIPVESYLYERNVPHVGIGEHVQF